jgi:hypothetical protein
MTTEDQTAMSEHDSAILAAIDNRLIDLNQQEDSLMLALAQVTAERRRYEKTRAALLGETRPPARPKEKPKVLRKGIGDPRLLTIRNAVLDFAADHEEFRQVDIRTNTGDNSGTMAIAFERLRQDNFIRFARRDGINKYFRLTRETLNGDGSDD